jgi:1-acyl-sn-glycerol-3-phosphate acyltransferase
MVRLLPPTPEGQSPLSWYGFAAVVLWPPMQVGTRRDWRGGDHLGSPGEGRILAANHISWFDPFVLAHFINDNGRNVRILAKASLFDVPLGGQVLKGTGQIPVKRQTGDAAAAVEAGVQAVEAGHCILMYPEGTITRDPDLWPMTGKTGVARMALRSRKPVIPVAQWGAQDVMGPYRVEARVLPRKTMRVAAGPPVALDDLYDEDPTAEVLAVATTRIMDAITAELAQLRGETPPEERWSMRSGGREPRGPTTVPGDR